MSGIVSVDGVPGYVLVREEQIKYKDREIERLKAELKAAETNANVFLQSLISTGDGRDNQLRDRPNEAKAEIKSLKRLMNDRAEYDKSMIESFGERTPEKLANFVELQLDAGSKTTFAAACLALMHRRYQDVVRKNSILAERNGKLANAIKDAAKVAIAN